VNLLHLFLASAATTYALMFLQHLTKSRVFGFLAGLMTLSTVLLLAALITGGTALVAATIGAIIGTGVAIYRLIRNRAALTLSTADAFATTVLFGAGIGMAIAVALSFFDPLLEPWGSH
jgi:hypothetical protein